MSVDIDTIEHMFEYGSVIPLTLHPESATRQKQVRALQEKISRLESPQIDHPVLPSHPSLEALFPGGGMRRGVSYELHGGYSLLWSLLAAPSQHGHWSALIGLGHLGLQAAADLGVDLDRVVVVKNPGSGWFQIASALADAVCLVVLAPQGTLPPISQRDRLHARLRERGSTLIVHGQWPGHEGRLVVEQCRWEGLDRGAGVLQTQHLTLAHHSKRSATPRRVHTVISADGLHAAPLAPVQVLGGQSTDQQTPHDEGHTLERVAG